MKLRLLVQSGGLSGHQVQLQNGSLLLGRNSECSLRFHYQTDPGVSSRHALIETRPEGFLLIDQQSTNGTFVNGQRIDQSWLKNGDLIRLGKTGPEIRVTIDSPQRVFPSPIPVAPEPLSEGLKNTITSAVFYNPEKEKSRSYMGVGVTLTVAGILAFVLFILILEQLGVVGTLVGGFMAIVPAPFYLLLFLWLDRYDPEPGWALIGAFGWGALFSLLVSYIVNTVFGSVAAAFIGGPEGDALAAVLSAPLIEEASKGLGVVLVMIFLRREFDGILDGLVYSGIVALGFATGENILYYGRTFLEGGVSQLLFTLFLRGILSPFAHSLFTSMTGIGCGISRETHNSFLRVAMPLIGYAGAVFLHALWNGIATLLGNLFFIAYFFIWVPLFLATLIFVLFMVKRERKIIREMLAVEVAGGFLTPEQLNMVGSLYQRTRWLLSCIGDPKKLTARRKYLRAVTKLGFCYWHVSRANAAHQQTISLPQIPRFRAEIASLRSQI